MKRIFLIVLLLSVSTLFAQKPNKNEALARHYYSEGNYEKAAILLEGLINKPSKSYYSMLFNSLIRLNEYEKLEKIIKKKIKKNKLDKSYQIDLAYVYTQNNKLVKSKFLNEKIINDLLANENEIKKVAYKYISFKQNEYLLKTYEKGNELFNDDSKFAYDIGEAYIKLNKHDKAIDYWLAYLDNHFERKRQIQSSFSRNFNKEGFQEKLELKLYEKIQDRPNQELYSEILIWVFINQKKFDNALIQAKALDKRNKNESYRIFELAQTAHKEGEYKSSVKAYKYLVEKGEESEFYRVSKTGILKARKFQILKDNNYTNEDLLALKNEYNDYLNTYGNGISNAKTVRELANLEAKYLNNVLKGISLIENLLKKVNIKKRIKNELKLDLGDMYILSGDVWEAVLIYAQVDKEEKDSPLGEDARYRNAKLSYYIGEFEWAQAQLTVLKGATTELIANDALKLSVFIIDNLGLDTSTTAIKMYSEAELLLIQNKRNDAISLLNEILTQFPQHALTDDIFFTKAKIYLQKKEYKNAEIECIKLINSYSTDILGDDATYFLAKLYEKKLLDKEKAKIFYKKIIVDYSDSIFLVEARKKYRQLRGDTQ